MNIVSKRIEKIEKYTNLSIELKELWGMKTVETIPLVIGWLHRNSRQKVC